MATILNFGGGGSDDFKVGTTANLPLITGTGGIVQAGSFGNAANTFTQGNDSRLSDARVASDVSAWAKAATKPSYTAAEVGAAESSHNHDSDYLKLSGGTVTGLASVSTLRFGKLEFAFSSNADYDTLTDGMYCVSGANSPNSDTNWLMNFTYDDNAYRAQMTILQGGTDMYIRALSGGAWGSWQKFINSGNYNSYSPTLTGIGASGTWPISISGTAADSSNANQLLAASATNPIALLGGGGLGAHGASATTYPVSAYENYGWCFTVQAVTGGSFKVMMSDRTTQLFRVDNSGNVYEGSTKLSAKYQKKITYGTAAPTGGVDGDIYIKY